MYLCKEVAIIFPLAFLLYIIFKREHIFKNSLFLIVGFFVPFLILNFTLFSGLSHSYSSQSANILSFEILKQPGYIFFFFYGILYFLMHVAIAAGFFPFVAPFLFYKNLNKKTQEILFFLILLIFTSALIITYTIYLKEDFYEPAPRALLRYISFVWVPILTVFFSLLENNLSRPNFRTVIYFFIPVFLILFVYKGAYPNIHHTMLYFLDLEKPKNVFYFKCIIIFFSFIFVLFFHNKKIILTTILLFFLFSMNIFNNWEVYHQFKKIYSAKNEDFKAIQQIENLIKENPHKNFIMGNTTWRNVKIQGLADSFLNYPNVYTIHIGKLSDNPPLKNILFSKMKLPMLWHFFYEDERFYHLDRVDYYILPKNLTHFVPRHGRKPVIIDIPNTEYQQNPIFHIYKNKTPLIYSPIHLTQIEN